MAATPVNTAATAQASPFGGGTNAAGTGGAKDGGAGFLSFLDQLFASVAPVGQGTELTLPGAASEKAAGEPGSGTDNIPPWLLAFSETETTGTIDESDATDLLGTTKTADNTNATTPAPSENPVDAIGDDDIGANAILAGVIDPTLTPPPAQPESTIQTTAPQTAATQTTATQTAATQATGEANQAPASDKGAAVARAAAELASQAGAKAGQVDKAPKPATQTPTQTPTQTGDAPAADPEIDGIVATLTRRPTQSTQTAGQATTTGGEAEQLARAANPAAQAAAGQSREGKTEKTRVAPTPDRAERPPSPENRNSDALSRLLAAAQSNRGGMAAGDGMGNQQAQAFKPAGTAPILLTINEIGAGATGMTGTATQLLAATDTATIAHTARPNMETLAVRIAQGVGNGTRSFEIELDPPELGRVEVRLEFARDGRVSTHLLVDRSDTLDALMRDARGLERALQAQGLKLEEGGVQYHLRDQSSFAQQQGGRDAPERSEPDALDNQDTATNTETAQPVKRHLALGGLDVRI